MKETQEFICEEIKPIVGSGDAAGASTAEPGLPRWFTWRGTQYEVVGVIEKWKTSGPCRHGSDEMYLRRHWYTVQTTPHAIMTIYFDRQTRRGQNPRKRWWVYSCRGLSEVEA